MATKHTTGPWKFGNLSEAIITPQGKRIAVVEALSDTMEMTPEARANAELLAAAPELLAALEAVLPLLPTGNLKACDDARLAVARAKGEA